MNSLLACLKKFNSIGKHDIDVNIKNNLKVTQLRENKTTALGITMTINVYKISWDLLFKKKCRCEVTNTYAQNSIYVKIYKDRVIYGINYIK